ncbi:MAG: L-Ala-D/L-Glu epimerase [Rhodospirillaceae bacterium]|nr:L-Ala-D/L-Glu epimerase [Rhodospirillaceae bacterium]
MWVLDVQHESWPIAGTFAISRGSRTSAEVVVVTLTDARSGRRGRGECVPYARYGESVDGVVSALKAMAPALARGQIDRVALQSAMPAGAARNALDCAFWDLEAKERGRPVWDLAGLERPREVVTAETLSLDTPDKMAESAKAKVGRPLLKLKLGSEGALDRVAAVRTARPDATLIVDANEALPPTDLTAMLQSLADLGVAMVEQPLPAGADDALANIQSPIPLCADESSHTAQDIPRLAGLYDMVNVKLDKTGGLTGAIEMVKAAESAGLQLMVGCMVGTSLGMAPAFLLASNATYVDLDGPVILAKDRDFGLSYSRGRVSPPLPDLWG